MIIKGPDKRFVENKITRVDQFFELLVFAFRSDIPEKHFFYFTHVEQVKRHLGLLVEVPGYSLDYFDWTRLLWYMLDTFIWLVYYYRILLFERRNLILLLGEQLFLDYLIELLFLGVEPVFLDLGTRLVVEDLLPAVFVVNIDHVGLIEEASFQTGDFAGLLLLFGRTASFPKLVMDVSLLFEVLVLDAFEGLVGWSLKLEDFFSDFLVSYAGLVDQLRFRLVGLVGTLHVGDRFEGSDVKLLDFASALVVELDTGL